MTTSNAHTLTSGDVREHFPDVMNQVGIKGERIVFQRNGKDLVAVVPIEGLELLETLEDRLDVTAAKSADYSMVQTASGCEKLVTCCRTAAFSMEPRIMKAPTTFHRLSIPIDGVPTEHKSK